MRLAEALQERADLNRKIEQLRYRLENNVLVQEGEITAENPDALKRELDNAVERLYYLISHINLTNSTVKIQDMTLTEMIARKDTLMIKLRTYREAVNTGSHATYRARGTEIKIRPAIDVVAWQFEMNLMAAEVRLLDNQLQEINWQTDLI